MIRTFLTLPLAAALTVLPFLSTTALTQSAKDEPALQQATSAKKISKASPQGRNALPDDSGRNARYIVQFEGDAVPLALVAKNSTSKDPSSSFMGSVSAQTTAARAEAGALQTYQNAMLSKMSAAAGAIQVLRTHQHALNAAVVRMSASTARKVQGMRGVRSVERDQVVELTTPTSVPFIGADQLWDGSATGGVPFQGEGVVVGIIDSGINHSHPSFAATGADGFTITNPLGEGVYLGECATIDGLCNSKLIGAYTFLDSQDSDPSDQILIPGDPPSSDTDGHGSHVAATAAGSVVTGAVLPDADGNPGSVVFDRVSGVDPTPTWLLSRYAPPPASLPTS